MCLGLLGTIGIQAQTVSFTPHNYTTSNLKYAYFSQENAVFATINGNENSATINVLNSNFETVHSFQISASMVGAGYIDYLDVTGAEPAKAYGVLVTQYLFNNDDLFEFIVWKENNNQYYVYNENGEFLGSCPGREIVIIRDNPYVQITDLNDSSNFTLYTIEKEGTNGNTGNIGEATLSIYGNQTYVLDMTYPYGAMATIEIEPLEGWDIYSVIFNDEDVTENLEDNKFVTNPLSGENTLEILMVESAGVSTLQIDPRNRISITRETDGILVGNVDPNETLKVYDLKGTLLYDGKDKFIPLNQKGMYILKSEKAIIKFAF